MIDGEFLTELTWNPHTHTYRHTCVSFCVTSSEIRRLTIFHPLPSTRRQSRGRRGSDQVQSQRQHCRRCCANDHFHFIRFAGKCTLVIKSAHVLARAPARNILPKIMLKEGNVDVMRQRSGIQYTSQEGSCGDCWRSLVFAAGDQGSVISHFFFVLVQLAVAIERQ